MELAANYLIVKITEMIEEADRDGSGSIEFQEFLMLMDKAEKEKWTKKDLKQVFTVFDKVNGSVQPRLLLTVTCLGR